MISRVMVIAVVCSTSIAVGSPQEDAQTAYTDGLAQYDAGRYSAAAVKFETAYGIDPDPAYLFNIAQAHRLSGACGKAVDYYNRFMAAAPSSPETESVTRYRNEAQRCAANTRLATSTKSEPRVSPVRRWTTWAIPAGVSAGVAIGFAIDGSLSRRKRDDYIADSEHHRLADTQAMDRRYRRDVWIRDIAMVTTGATTITAAVVFLTRSSAKLAVTPAISGNATGVMLRGRF